MITKTMMFALRLIWGFLTLVGGVVCVVFIAAVFEGKNLLEFADSFSWPAVETVIQFLILVAAVITAESANLQSARQHKWQEMQSRKAASAALIEAIYGLQSAAQLGYEKVLTFQLSHPPGSIGTLVELAIIGHSSMREIDAADGKFQQAIEMAQHLSVSATVRDSFDAFWRQTSAQIAHNEIQICKAVATARQGGTDEDINEIIKPVAISQDTLIRSSLVHIANMLKEVRRAVSQDARS